MNSGALKMIITRYESENFNQQTQSRQGKLRGKVG